MNVCLPGFVVRAAGGTLSQALAYIDTNLAMHNADNYAGFAIDVALSNWTWTPALHYDPNDPNQKKVSRKFDKVQSVSSILAEFEGYSTVTVSKPTPISILPRRSQKWKRNLLRYVVRTDYRRRGENEIEAIFEITELHLSSTSHWRNGSFANKAIKFDSFTVYRGSRE